MYRIEVANLSKCYRLGNRDLEVLHDLNFSVEDNSFVTIVGRSGCGKTTLLRIMANLESASRGNVRFISDGQAIPKVSIVFQEPRLMPWLTVEQNIAFPARRGSAIDEEHSGRTLEMYLDLLGLKRFAKAYPSQISGGMAQRVALGRTLFFEPEIILMDEPFGDLDAFTRRNLQKELIKIFQNQKRTFLFVTHDVDEAIFLGQRVLVLDRGRLVSDIPVDLTYPRDPLSNPFYLLREQLLSLFQ
jgi:sulfonate transport system ATP-binding protein